MIYFFQAGVLFSKEKAKILARFSQFGLFRLKYMHLFAYILQAVVYQNWQISGMVQQFVKEYCRSEFHSCLCARNIQGLHRLLAIDIYVQVINLVNQKSMIFMKRSNE